MLNLRQKFLALGYGLALIGSFTFVGGMARRSFPLAVLGIGSGIASWLILRDREAIDHAKLDEDTIALFKAGYTVTNQGIVKAGASLSRNRAVKGATAAIIKYSPPVRPKQIFKRKQLEGADWLGKFLDQPHHWIMGQTGHGKTHVTLKTLAYRVQQNPDALVFIGDKNYGKGSGKWGDGEPNTWLDISLDCVYTEIAEIANMIKTIVEATEAKDGFSGLKERIKIGRDAAKKRKKAKSYPFIYIYLDEWNDLQAEINSNSNFDYFLRYINMIANEGRGYKVLLCLIGQHCRVNESGITQTQRRQFAFLVVGGDATNNMILGDIPGAEADKLVESAKKINREKLGRGACIVKLDDDPQPQARIMPYIDLNFKFQEQYTPEQLWWQEAWEDNTELKTWVVEEMTSYLHGIRSHPRAEILEKLSKFCDRKIQMSLDDPLYTEWAKPTIDEVEDKMREHFELPPRKRS